jgi:hypothetical protein
LILFVIFVLVAGVLTVGLVLVVWGTIARNNWGINLRQTFCPRCKASLPRKRIPTSKRQAMWGGWTCSACGAELDKWGREIH